MIFPNRNNTLIVVVTFNPDSDFAIHLNRYLKIVERCIIVDNHSECNIKEYIPKNLCHHFELVSSDKNRGIAWGLNQGIQYAIDNGYLYVLTLDQDSFPVENILNIYGSFIFRKKCIGLVGTSFISRIPDKINCNCEFRPKLTIITSGTLHAVNIFSDIGLYDEKLFIDSVDFDFSLRVRMKGYKVFRSTQPLIGHHLGNPIVRLGIKSSNHSIIRRYYMARNHVYVTKKYFKCFPWWVIKKNLNYVYSLLTILIVEKQREEKFKVIFKGICDGFTL